MNMTMFFKKIIKFLNNTDSQILDTDTHYYIYFRTEVVRERSLSDDV